MGGLSRCEFSSSLGRRFSVRHCAVAPMPAGRRGYLVGRTTLADLLGWTEAWSEETATKFGCPRMLWVAVENDGDSASLGL